MICPTSALLPAAICQAVYVTRQTWGGPRLELGGALLNSQGGSKIFAATAA